MEKEKKNEDEDGGSAISQQSGTGRHQFKYRLFKTICMVLGPAAMGIYLELTGPTLNDLRQRVPINNRPANYEEISRALVARSIGYFVGSAISGFLSDKYADHVELFLSGAFLFGSLGTVFTPWMRQLWQVGLMMLLQGIGQGCIDTNNNVLCLRLWGVHAAAPVHALHFGFGIGAMIAPQLARPFISDVEGNKTNVTGGGPNVTDPKLAPIEIPYSISAVIVLAFSIIFLSFYIYDRFHEQKQATRPTLADLRRIFSPGSCAGGRIAFGIQIFILIFFFYFNIVGGERAYGKFLYSYATKTNNFNKDTATTLNSVFWLCFTAGRGVAIVAAKWVSPKYLLPVELSCNVLCGLVLSVWGFEVRLVLWIFTCLLGLTLAPIFPAGLAWSNLYVEMSGMAVALVFIGSSSGGAFYQYLTGVLFDKHPRNLMYVMLGYALFLSAIYLLMSVLTYRVKERFSSEDVFVNKDSGREMLPLSQNEKPVRKVKEPPPPKYKESADATQI